MYRRYIRPACLIFALWATAGAAGAADSASALYVGWARDYSAPSQFILRLMAVDRAALTSRVQTRRLRLLERDADLRSQVQHNRFQHKDVVLAAVMPGGLLYAAYKQAKLKALQARQTAAEQELAELATDLQQLQPPALSRMVVAEHQE
jgi:hypothetical protein